MKVEYTGTNDNGIAEFRISDLEPGCDDVDWDDLIRTVKEVALRSNECHKTIQFLKDNVNEDINWQRIIDNELERGIRSIPFGEIMTRSKENS